MTLGHGPKIVTDGLVFAYDMNPIINGRPASKSWKGAPTFNASLQDGQNDVSPWSGDGSPTSLGIDSGIRFRGRKVAKFQTGTSGNCYINGAGDLSTGTTSTVWTSTIYLKRVDNTPLTSVGMYQYITNNSNVNSTRTLTPVEDGWYQAVYTRSGLVAGYPTLTGMYSLGTATQYYFADWQCENNSFSTPWVSGTRSNTQALLDWAGNNTITLNGMQYNSDGTFQTSGATTTDYISIANGALSAQASSGSWTIDFWLKLNARNSGLDHILQTGAANNFLWFLTGSTLNYQNSNSTTIALPTISTNTWFNLTMTGSGGSVQVYKNGAYVGAMTNTTTFSIASTIGIIMGQEMDSNSGAFDSTQSFQGYYGSTKFYNKPLTAAEVAQNFQALRGRYGI